MNDDSTEYGVTWIWTAELKAIAAQKTAIYTYSAVADAMSAKEQNGRLVAYAEKNGMEVVKTYADEGGVRKNRERMFAEIADGTADFDVLLLRDITRWGVPKSRRGDRLRIRLRPCGDKDRLCQRSGDRKRQHRAHRSRGNKTHNIEEM